ncbi:hypothetical protein L2E82_51965 [Cichorium intybus]|nr:hypothetical protein L2E82_51965 [Cichorium intybus]
MPRPTNSSSATVKNTVKPWKTKVIPSIIVALLVLLQPEWNLIKAKSYPRTLSGHNLIQAFIEQLVCICKLNLREQEHYDRHKNSKVALLDNGDAVVEKWEEKGRRREEP